MTIPLDRGDRNHGGATGFRHEAFFYRGDADFLRGATGFVEDGLRAGERVMVALRSERLEVLRSRLGHDADRVAFADMHEIGRNPARIIPAWRRFVEEHAGAGRPFRGIGEPIWRERGPDELIECQLHETLLNVAFGGRPGWRLMCPYDEDALAEDVLEEARRSHPFIYGADGARASTAFEHRSGPALLAGTLPEPTAMPAEFGFRVPDLVRLRHMVSKWASGRLPAHRAADLVLAVHEVAANSVLHGGGAGRLRYWRESHALVCEVSDTGRIAEELVGRALPATDGEMGRGLWLAHQLCDLVQLRSSDRGTVVRLTMATT